MLNYTINHAAHSPYDLTPDSSHQDVRCCGSPKPPSFVRAMRKPTMAQQKHLMLLKRNGCLDFAAIFWRLPRVILLNSFHGSFLVGGGSSLQVSAKKSLKLPPTIIKWYCPVAILTYQMLPLIMTIFYQKKTYLMDGTTLAAKLTQPSWTLR